MEQSDMVVYMHSNHSRASRWMPWELGYYDGRNGNVAVLPILPDNGSLSFNNKEYLQLYPQSRHGRFVQLEAVRVREQLKGHRIFQRLNESGTVARCDRQAASDSLSSAGLIVDHAPSAID